MIGMTFALIRVSVAFISGIVTGLIVDFLKITKMIIIFQKNEFHDF